MMAQPLEPFGVIFQWRNTKAEILDANSLKSNTIRDTNQIRPNTRKGTDMIASDPRLWNIDFIFRIT